jgi:hypothetical protein
MKRGGVDGTNPLIELMLHRWELGIIVHDGLQWEKGKSSCSRCQRPIMGGIAGISLAPIAQDHRWLTIEQQQQQQRFG